MRRSDQQMVNPSNQQKPIAQQSAPHFSSGRESAKTSSSSAINCDKDGKKSNSFNCNSHPPTYPVDSIPSSVCEREKNIQFPPSQINMDNPKSNNNNQSSAAYLKGRPKHPPPYDQAITKSSLLSTTKTSGQVKASHVQQSFVDQHGSTQVAANNTNNNINHKRRQPAESVFQYSPSNSPQKPKYDSSSPSDFGQKLHKKDSHYHNEVKHRDAIKLVSMQKDTMATQKQELMELDAEITFFERQIKLQEEKSKDIEMEISHLEKLWMDQEAQIAKMELLNYEEEIDILRKEREKIEMESNNLKAVLNSTDSQIAKCRQNIQSLINDINELEKIRQYEEARKEEETEKRFFVDLRQQTRETCKEFERQVEDLVEDELRNIEELVKEKTVEMEKIRNELREANLQGLTLTPREDPQICQTDVDMSISVSENRFYHRPGSTRRMFGSPRELENAVATNKNPHGVWV